VLCRPVEEVSAPGTTWWEAFKVCEIVWCRYFLGK
jgi:hypothetical protein